MVSVTQLDWRVVGAVKHIPVVDGISRDQTQMSVVKPFPKHNRLVHGVRLQPLLGAQVEYLQRGTIGPQGDDELFCVHDGIVGTHVLSGDLIVVLQINDGHRVPARGGFSNTDKPIRLQRRRLEVKRRLRDPERRQLRDFREINWYIVCHFASSWAQPYRYPKPCVQSKLTQFVSLFFGDIANGNPRINPTALLYTRSSVSSIMLPFNPQ